MADAKQTNKVQFKTEEIKKSLKELIEDFQYKKANKKVIAVYVNAMAESVETSVSALKKHDGNKLLTATTLEVGNDFYMTIQF